MITSEYIIVIAFRIPAQNVLFFLWILYPNHQNHRLRTTTNAILPILPRGSKHTHTRSSPLFLFFSASPVHRRAFVCLAATRRSIIIQARRARCVGILLLFVFAPLTIPYSTCLSFSVSPLPLLFVSVRVQTSFVQSSDRILFLSPMAFPSRGRIPPLPCWRRCV